MSGAGDIANFLNNTGLTNLQYPWSRHRRKHLKHRWHHSNHRLRQCEFVSGESVRHRLWAHTARVNVGGSVSFTTAQYLRLFDGVNSANFYANPANDGLANSVLAVAPVVDFGFLSPAAYGFLTAPDPSCHDHGPGQRAVRAFRANRSRWWAGTVVIQGAHTSRWNGPSRHTCRRRTARFNLASAASPGEFDVPTLQPLPNVDGALVYLVWVGLPGAGLEHRRQRPSTVFIKGGQLVLSVNDATLSTSESPAPTDTISLSPGSSIVDVEFGNRPGADVQLIASRSSRWTGAHTFNGQQLGSGRGGDVQLTADTLTMENAHRL